MKVLKGKKKLCAVKATTFFIELLFALEMVEELSSVDESTPSQSDSEARQGKGGTHASTRYNFCSDWKLNLSGTMKGLVTLESTRRSARVCVISPRSTICALRMVFKA
jgi:hypothetical protein